MLLEVWPDRGRGSGNRAATGRRPSQDTRARAGRRASTPLCTTRAHPVHTWPSNFLARFARNSDRAPITAPAAPRGVAMFAAARRYWSRPAPLAPPFSAPPPFRRRLLRAPVSDDELLHAWHRIQQELRSAVGDSIWHIWLEPLEPRSLEGGVLVVEAPDAIRPWVGGRFSRVLRACTEAVLGPGVQVELVAPGVRSTTPPPAPRGSVIEARLRLQPSLHLRPVRHRRRQPPRPRGGAHGLRDARARLQPALHLRPARPRQDPPAALDRQLRARSRRRTLGALHHGRGLHRPVRRRAAERRDRGLQVRLPQRRRPARRRRASSSRARSVPSRSSSTPSTRSRARAPSWC